MSMSQHHSETSTNYPLNSRHNRNNPDHKRRPLRHCKRHRKLLPTNPDKSLSQLTPSQLTITSSVTAISSTTVTTTITRTSEAPRAFPLLFSDIASSTTSYGHISRPTDRPGSSGTLITFRDGAINADLFSLNAQNQLVTSPSLDVLTLEKNSRDPFPFLFLENGTTVANTPVFSVCEGVLRAEYPGTQGNGFALCDGFLSLGVDAVTGAPQCQRISLGFGEIPSGQILPQ
jgi:hypothetical protein